MGYVAGAEYGHPHRFSVGATFLGWCVASFLTVLFLAIIGGILGGAATGMGQQGVDWTNLGALGIGSAIGALIGMFLAYLVGGYAAGRIAHWQGAKHGAMVPVWTIVIGILASIAGALFGARMAMPQAMQGIDFGGLAGWGLLGLLLTLLVMFGGAILGGRLGERGEHRYVERPARREVRGGRPF